MYPFLPSGNLLVSDIGAGLFVLGDRTRTSANGQLGFTAAAYGGVEGDTVTVSVARSAGTAGAVGVDYAVTTGSAGAADFTASQGTLTWAANEDGTRSIEVPLTSDARAESLERAFVRLANPTGGAVLGDVSLASVFIGDANATVKVGFAETSITVEEGRRAVVAVRRLGSPVGAVEVGWSLVPGTASAGTDYSAAASGTLSWADGDARAKTFVVAALADDDAESTESFEVRLGTPSGAVIDGATALEVTIEDADTVAVRGFTQIISSLHDRADLDIAPLRNGMAVKHRQHWSWQTFLHLSAIVRGTADRVVFELSDGEATRRMTVDRAPHTFYYVPAPTKSGNYTLTATPYPDEDGPPGTAQSVTFAVDNGSNQPATGAPSITQSTVVHEGEALHASRGSIEDADGTSNAKYRYQWWRSGDGAAELIPTATSSTYRAHEVDMGREIRVEARFVDDAGYEESRTSESTGKIHRCRR